MSISGTIVSALERVFCRAEEMFDPKSCLTSLPGIKHWRRLWHSAPQFSKKMSGRGDNSTKQLWESDKGIPTNSRLPTKPHCHHYYGSSSVISLKNEGTLYISLSSPTARITSSGCLFKFPMHHWQDENNYCVLLMSKSNTQLTGRLK